MFGAWRKVEQEMLKRIDWTSIALSLAYVSYDRVMQRQFVAVSLCILALSVLAYLAKRREKVVYSALAYGLLSVVVAYWLQDQRNLAGFDSYVWIPVLAFVAALFLEWQTSWITGMLLGLWAALGYTSYLQGRVTGFESFQEASTYIPLMFLAGGLLFLFAKGTRYRYAGDIADKLDFTLILLGIGYAWSAWKQPGQPIGLAVLYLGLTLSASYAKQRNGKWTAPLAYAIFAMIVLLQLELTGNQGRLYLLLLVPMAVFGLTLAFSLKTNAFTYLGAGYWLAVFLISLRADVEGVEEQIAHVFRYETAIVALNGVWWMFVLAIALAHPGWVKSLSRWKSASR